MVEPQKCIRCVRLLEPVRSSLAPVCESDSFDNGSIYNITWEDALVFILSAQGETTRWHPRVNR